jgi:hypothetical protein
MLAVEALKGPCSYQETQNINIYTRNLAQTQEVSSYYFLLRNCAQAPAKLQNLIF